MICYDVMGMGHTIKPISTALITQVDQISVVFLIKCGQEDTMQRDVAIIYISLKIPRVESQKDGIHVEFD